MISQVDILIELRIMIQRAQREHDAHEESLRAPGLDAHEFALRALDGQRFGVRYRTLTEVWEIITESPWQR
jgi:hypothetical protein